MLCLYFISIIGAFITLERGIAMPHDHLFDEIKVPGLLSDVDYVIKMCQFPKSARNSFLLPLKWMQK